MATNYLRRFAATGQPHTFALLALALGQLLFWMGFGVVYVVALTYVLAVCLPYPKIVHSLAARAAVGLLLAFSIIQAMAAVQVIVFPASNFGMLSLLVTAATLGLIWCTRRIPSKVAFPIADRSDAAGVVAGLFFVLPMLVLCFGPHSLDRIATFAGLQGSDGASHYTMIAEMNTAEHLTYRSTEYYPKGFHLASAFMLHGLHANQSNLDWANNARLYLAMYLAWGALVAYLAVQLASQLLASLTPRKRPPLFLVAISIGPILAATYLATFSQEGFLSYFYIIAAVLAGLLYLEEGRTAQWPLVLYLLLAFGVAMSWGPLLTPLLLAIPVLYMWPELGPLRTIPRMLVSPRWRWVSLAFVVQVVPLYLHLNFARLASEQGLNATGGLKAFHFGLALAGLALVTYVLGARMVPDAWRRFVGNVLLPFYIVVGLIVCLQYVTAGELRYYAIKISDLLEIVVIVTASVAIGSLLYQRKLTIVHRWLALPIVLGIGVILLTGLTTNPFDHARIIFGNLVGSQPTADIRHYVALGSSGQLSTNSVSLHYDADNDRLTGNAVLANWSHLMLYSSDNTPAVGICNGRIFELQAHSVGGNHNGELISAIKDCAAAAHARHKPYFIVTDARSVEHLRTIFKDSATYLY